VISINFIPFRIDRSVDKLRKDTQHNFASQKSELPSRADLESFYAKAIRMPDRDDNKASVLSHLGRTYHVLYQEGQEKTDLEKAISLHEEAMQFTSSFHPQLAERAHHFSTALIERFQQSGDPDDIERAISHCQTALNFTEDPDADRSSLLSNLGSALGLRFERMGDHANMENAIMCQRQAVE
jgi:SpoVK/Ycf46/Vps4 family AAA+-type ATPase